MKQNTSRDHLLDDLIDIYGLLALSSSFCPNHIGALIQYYRIHFPLLHTQERRTKYSFGNQAGLLAMLKVETMRFRKTSTTRFLDP